MSPDGHLEFDADYDPLVSVRVQRLGPTDPTFRFETRGFWQASNTPAGPVCVHVRGSGARIVVDAWGEGAVWALEHMPRVCGADDALWREPIEPAWLDALARARERDRLGQALRPADLLWRLVLQQRVRFPEAARSWRKLARRIGAAAPGPGGLTLPPTDLALRSLRVADYAALGVDAKRARTLRACALHGGKLDRLLGAPLAEVRSLLPKLPGIGPWTAALLLACGFGDADAVPVGDYHLPNTVAYAFKRQRRGTDDEMLALLEPYRGNRYRVLRLLMLGGPRRPRGGPRLVTTPL